MHADYESIAKQHRLYYGEGERHFLSFVLSQIKDAGLLEPGLRLYRLEPRLQSHYKPDLILQDKDGRYVAVEVEPDFPGDNDTGVWQAVAYKHVLAAELKLPCDQVRGFLVAPRIPDGIKQKCRHLGVEPFELGEGPAAAGYNVKLIFLNLPTADLAVARVASRVAQGGHNVPESVIRRRFDSGLRNFHNLYRTLANSWALYDNSGTSPRLIAWGENP